MLCGVMPAGAALASTSAGPLGKQVPAVKWPLVECTVIATQYSQETQWLVSLSIACQDGRTVYGHQSFNVVLAHTLGVLGSPQGLRTNRAGLIRKRQLCSRGIQPQQLPHTSTKEKNERYVYKPGRTVITDTANNRKHEKGGAEKRRQRDQSTNEQPQRQVNRSR